MKIRTFLLLTVCCLAASASFATDYYVDATSGSDAADGKTPETAWQTLKRVNAADELVAGDVVRFKCGEVFRGSLKPHSGEKGNPITYTSYGEGLKPSFWRSVSLAEESDWIDMGNGRWATRPTTVKEVGDGGDFLKSGKWVFYQEPGAKAACSAKRVNGNEIFNFHCDTTGKASNNIQWYKSGFAIENDVCYQLSFDVKSSRAISFNASLMTSDSPWASCGSLIRGQISSDTETRRCVLVYKASRDYDDARLTFYLGNLGDDLDIEVSNIETKTVEVDALELGPDVGNIILNHEKAAFKRWVVDDLVEDGNVKLPGLNEQDDFVYDRGEGRVWFRSDENPAKVYESIEAAVMIHVVDHSNVHDAVFDGLDIRYGAAHGFGGSNAERLVIRNCDIAWIGGGDQYREGAQGRRTRFGNGIEFWASASDCLVENNRIWEVYDAALTNQGKDDNVERNITYRGNVIWNCEYSFEYWNGATSVTENIEFVDNYCLNAGFGWGHVQRRDPNGRCLMFYGNHAKTTNFVIMNNVFANATDSLVRNDKVWEPEPTNFIGNIYYQDPSMFEDEVPPYVRWVDNLNISEEEFKSKYQEELGVDVYGKISEIDAESIIPTYNIRQ